MKTRVRRAAALIPLLCSLALLLVACNFPGGTATPAGDPFATAAAQTVAAELTQSGADATPAPATATEGASATPAPTDTPGGATATPNGAACTNRVDFVSDVTVPDDTVMEAGEDFTKTWRLRNSGTCSWDTQYDLVFDSGRSMGASAAVPLPGNVAPDSTVDLSVDMTAPASNGTYRGNWMLRDPEGQKFGIGTNASTAFWVQIRVGPTPTPEPETYKTGKDDLRSSFRMDLDEIEAETADSSDNDFWYHAAVDDDYVEPVNGALFRHMGDEVPSHADCDDASLSSDPIPFADFDVGDFFCFESTEGRLGIMQIENIGADSWNTLTVDVRVWED